MVRGAQARVSVRFSERFFSAGAKESLTNAFDVLVTTEHDSFFK
jgi:hypothetical protein